MLHEPDASLGKHDEHGGSAASDDVGPVAIEIDRQTRRSRVSLDVAVAEIQTEKISVGRVLMLGKQIEAATPPLARSCSTTELFPRSSGVELYHAPQGAAARRASAASSGGAGLMKKPLPHS